MCDFLLGDGGLFYVLPGKISSDPIEARFGAYRRLSGANFFISCKQLFEAEKKLRTLNLIKAKIPVSRLNFTVDFDDEGSSPIDRPTDLELCEITGIDADDLDEAENTIVYFVAGYVGRSIARRNKCSDCKQILLCENPSSPEDRTQIFDALNRGGLSSPTEFCHAVCLLSFLYFKQCQEDTHKMRKLLSLGNQKAAFVSNILDKLTLHLGIKTMTFRRCKNGHLVLRPIVGSVFNCFAKNLKRHINTDSKSESKAQKIKKLQSKG